MFDGGRAEVKINGQNVRCTRLKFEHEVDSVPMVSMDFYPVDCEIDLEFKKCREPEDEDDSIPTEYNFDEIITKLEKEAIYLDHLDVDTQFVSLDDVKRIMKGKSNEKR